MEIIKANILKAISDEHTSVHRFVSSCYGDTALDESMESKMVSLFTNSMNRWADARRTMHKSLNQMIRIATERQNNIVKGYAFYASDVAWVTQTGYEAAITETNKHEHEIVALTYLMGFSCDERTSIFAKLTSLIEF
jgi:hypothetical protein